MKKIKLSIFLLAAVGLMTSCNDFLNKYPDNRMELRTPSDVSKLVASAYPDAYPAYLLEMYSDNTDEQVASKNKPMVGLISPRRVCPMCPKNSGMPATLLSQQPTQL